MACPATGARHRNLDYCGHVSVPFGVRLSTGEPDAGDPPVRFGGRGDRNQSVFPTPIATRLIHQALLGLQHLHAEGVVHRDLKPANLMLVPARAPGELDTTLQATVKILDIGLGRALFDEGASGAGPGVNLTSTGDILGVPDYMAPEQAADAHAVDIRADIYTLGCVLYQTLTGQTPFPDTSPVRQMIRHATETPRSFKELKIKSPDDLEKVVLRMLAKDPAQRVSDAGACSRGDTRFLRAPQGTCPPGSLGQLSA